MDDGGSTSMKEVKPLEDLFTPASQHFYFHHFETLQVSKRKTQSFLIITADNYTRTVVFNYLLL